MFSPRAFSALKRGAVYSPSICPPKARTCSEALCSNTENLMLEEPAFRTRMASVMTSRSRRALAPPLGHERRHCARSETGHHRVGAARQDDRDTRAQHDACRIGPSEE